MACQRGCDNCPLCDLRLTRRTAVIGMERGTEGVGEAKVGLRGEVAKCRAWFSLPSTLQAAKTVRLPGPDC